MTERRSIAGARNDLPRLVREAERGKSVSFPVLDYDRRAADWHAVERARLSAAGRTPPFVDGQIAAIARVNDLVLITSNKDDLRGFEGLRTRSWR